jgi:hypothetical protein
MNSSNSGYVELVAGAAEQASVAIRQPRFGQPLPITVVVVAADPVPVTETVQAFAMQAWHASTVHGPDVSARHCVGASQARRHTTDVAEPSPSDVANATTAQASEPAADMRDARTAHVPQTASADVPHAAAAEMASPTAEVASPTAMTTAAAARQRRRGRRGNSKGDGCDRRKHNLAHFESPVAVTACSLAAFEEIEISRAFAWRRNIRRPTADKPRAKRGPARDWRDLSRLAAFEVGAAAIALDAVGPLRRSCVDRSDSAGFAENP